MISKITGVEETEDEKIEREEAEAAANPELTDRQKAMQEIEAAREPEALADAEESLVVVDEDGKPTPVVETEEEIAAKAVEAKAVLPADTTTEVKSDAIDPNAEYELEVDGQKIKVKGDKIFDAGRRTIQKEVAADVRLDLANRLLAEAEQRTKIKTEETPKASELDLKAVVKAIQLGTEEQGAEALTSLMKHAQEGAITRDEIVALIEGPVAQKMRGEIEFTAAREFANVEYGDLMKDPYLQRLFLVEERRRRAPRDQGGEADSRNHRELYKSIGEDLRKAFNRPKLVSGKPTLPAAQKIEDKAKNLQVPRTAAARIETPGPAKSPSTVDVINEMRKARHQQTLQ